MGLKIKSLGYALYLYENGDQFCILFYDKIMKLILILKGGIVTKTASLIDFGQWVDPTLRMADKGDVLEFHIQDALNYHGYDAVGGVVLGFRLLQKTMAHFFASTTQTFLQRRGLSLLTAFPGLGARDCFELITRMVTDGRMVVNTGLAHPAAQEGVEGQFFFEFVYEGRSVQLAPIEAYPGDAFIALGKASKLPHFSQIQQQAWRNAKYALANTLLAADAQTVIRVL